MPVLAPEVDENAVAAAKLVFNQGGRKSVGLCGRQAPVARRLLRSGPRECWDAWKTVKT